jgi:predicted dehydrogenase
MRQSCLDTLGRRLRLGMVGGGEASLIGETHRIASRLDGLFDLVAGSFSSNRERGRQMGQKLMIAADRCYPDAATMASAEAARADGIDAVTICTPPEHHAEAARTFLAAGIHVICDKPLTNDPASARALAADAAASDCLFAVSYNYAAYPMIREARQRVADGAIGRPRVAVAEFAVGTGGMINDDPDPGARHWRFDPDRVGRGGIFLEIGTHAFHLMEFVSGLAVTAVSAHVDTQSPGRRVFDNAFVTVRFDNDAIGHVWLSYTATGSEHGLNLRLHGDKAGLAWHQETPNALTLTPPDGPRRTLTRGMPGLSGSAERFTRVRSGHPEGFHDAFANIYLDVAEHIAARLTLTTPDPLSADLPTAADGLRGLAFMEAALKSHDQHGAWAELVP